MMQCERFRERIGADPADTAPDLAEHEGACPPCAAYAVRLRQTERVIHAALRFDSGDLEPAGGDRRPRPLVWASAAAVAVALIAGWAAVGLIRPVTSEELVAEVIAHWEHEPGSYVTTDVGVTRATLERALDGRAELDLGGIGTVSYARLCRVAGQWMPHLVVQSDVGPIAVLLMPGRYVESPMPVELSAEGIRGTLAPYGRGSIAVLGDAEASLEAVEGRITSAVTWTI